MPLIAKWIGEWIGEWIAVLKAVFSIPANKQRHPHGGARLPRAIVPPAERLPPHPRLELQQGSAALRRRGQRPWPCDRHFEAGDGCVALARRVCRLSDRDRRAPTKRSINLRAINLASGSGLVEPTSDANLLPGPPFP